METKNYLISGPGKKRRRIWRIQGENKVNSMPYMIFHEEEVICDENGIEVSLNRTREIIVNFDDIDKRIDLRNPMTDEVIGTFSIKELYIMLYSLGRNAQFTEDIKEGNDL
jgi:hypothetical protein